MGFWVDKRTQGLYTVETGLAKPFCVAGMENKREMEKKNRKKIYYEY